ncbi:MAG: hypothetical protein Q9227_009028 [Pyrenula ochraceoflavens]
MAIVDAYLDEIEQLINAAATSARSIRTYRLNSVLGKTSSTNVSSVLLPEHAPPHIHKAQRVLLQSAVKLEQLSTNPTEFLERQAVKYQHLACLRWLVNLDILPRIPLSGHISYATLAAESQVPEHQLKGVIRMAITNNFLSEPTPGNVVHNSNSAKLVTDKSFMDWARFMTNSSAPTAAKFSEATQRWGLTQAKNETAYQLAAGTELAFFDHLKLSQSLTDQFAGYMKNVTAADGTSIKHLLSGFNWTQLADGAKIVDIGGSSGHASIALARSYPHLSFVVQDLPETIANCSLKEELASDPEIASRISYMPHDFFQPQPIKDADVYLLRMIIHDWPDPEAIKILKHTFNALENPGARILIMDTVLPPSGSITTIDESRLRVRDLTMMQVFNAKEREADDWKALLESFDLRILDMKQPEGSVMAVMNIGKKDTQSPRHVPVNGYYSHGNPMDIMSLPLTNGINGHFDGQKHPVLIIGAGIGGLCLAQGLKKTGVACKIFERDQSATFRAQGYRLKIEASGDGALQSSLPPTVYQKFVDTCASFYLGETDFNPISGHILRSRQGSGLAWTQGGLRPARTADRTVMRSVLMTGLEDSIYYGKELLRYEMAPETDMVVAHFTDGSFAEGSLLVGADGAKSAVRKQYLPDQKHVDTGACCIYGKTPISDELLERFPRKALRWMTICADTAPMLQSVLIEESPLTLLTEPIRFDQQSKYSRSLPPDYVYWVLIARKEVLFENEAQLSKLASLEALPSDSAALSLELTKEWDPNLRSLFELQDTKYCSTIRVASAVPEAPEWTPSPYITLLGDAIHVMSPCGGVGANTALADAADLVKVISNSGQVTADAIGEYENTLRKRATASLMRSFIGSKKMFNQQPYSKCPVIEL